MSQPSFFAELKRRNVIRVAVAYVAVGWLVMQVCTLGVGVLELPNSISKGLLVLLAAGFIPAMVFSWVYEITPEGLKRESEVETHESITHLTGRKLDYIVIGVLGAIVALLLVDKFVVTPRLAARAVGSAPAAAAPAAAPAGGVAASATGVPEIAQDPSIAVLPMVNMSDDKANDYFSDGISEELLNLLAKVPELRVIARTSSFSFRGQNLEIPEIARRLHVASVLEGSVRKSADKVRITVQLIRASDGSHLWSETYDRTLDDIFKVQDEIAATVVKELQVKLLGAAPTVKPVDARAYPLILQAKALIEVSSIATRAQAIALYRQALTIAPREPRAWVGLAQAYTQQVAGGEVPAQEGVRLAREAGEKALEIDPGDAAAHAALGRIYSELESDLPRAAEHLQKALAAEPGNLYVLNNAAILLGSIGRVDEGTRLLEYVVQHDPASANAYNNLGIHQYRAERWDAAIRSLRTALDLSREITQVNYQIGLSLLLGKRDAEAALKELEAEPDELTRMSAVPMALQALGRGSEADAAFKALVAKFGDQPTLIASTCSYRGQTDAAFEWLDKAVAAHDPILHALVLSDPLYKPLHGDPRWLPLMRRIGYAPEQLAKIELKATLPK